MRSRVAGVPREFRRSGDTRNRACQGGGEGMRTSEAKSPDASDAGKTTKIGVLAPMSIILFIALTLAGTYYVRKGILERAMVDGDGDRTTTRPSRNWRTPFRCPVNARDERDGRRSTGLRNGAIARWPSCSCARAPTSTRRDADGLDAAALGRVGRGVAELLIARGPTSREADDGRRPCTAAANEHGGRATSHREGRGCQREGR